MRVQLTEDHWFNTPCGGVKILAGSFVGANVGDFPVSQISNFQVTMAMVALDGAATTAQTAEASRVAGRPGVNRGQTAALVTKSSQT